MPDYTVQYDGNGAIRAPVYMSPYTIKNVPKEKYMNIIKGFYEAPEKYISK
jgi:patatin-like phospholipase/acyl hydrolase